jgi:Tfp pilus assembly protein PilF
MSILAKDQAPARAHPARAHSTKKRHVPSGWLPRGWRALGGLAALLICAVALVAQGPGEAAYLAAGGRAQAALRYDRALTFYAQAAARAPTQAEPWCRQGAVLLLQGLWSAAGDAYQRCVARDSARADGWLGLGQALAQAGKSADAQNAWQRAAALGSIDAWRRLARAAEAAGRAEAARSAWAALPASDAEAAAHLGMLALLRGDVSAAQQAFLIARAHPGPASDSITQSGLVALAARPLATSTEWARLGYGLLTMGEIRLALAPLRTATTLDPTNGEAHAYLGWAEWLTGATADARTLIALGVRLAPEKSFPWYAAGQLAAADGHTATALSNFQRGLALDARNPVIWAAAGQARLAEHDYLSAELSLESAAELSQNPADTAAFLTFYRDTHLGLADGRARRAVNMAQQRWPQDAKIALLCGQIDDLLNDPASAYYAYLRAKTLDPTQPGPYVALARHAEAEGQYLTAAIEARTALALQPEGALAGQARALLAPLARIDV